MNRIATMRLFALAPCCLSISILGLSGCVSSPVSPSAPNVAETAFTDSDTFSRTYGDVPEASCEAARRALLSQAYLITDAKPTSIAARKNFQQTREQHYEVEFHITCVSNPGATSTVFVSAVQQLYGLRKTNSSASVGVSVLGSLSVPIKSEDDSIVKIGSSTITKPSLYQRFFDLLENYLASSSPNTEAQPKAPSKAPKLQGNDSLDPQASEVHSPPVL